MTTETATPKVLVVEDEFVTQQFLKNMLHNVGIDATICGEAALGIYHYVSDPSYDAVILDLIMPGIGGREFLAVAEAMYRKGIRSGPGKIIVYSAMKDFEELKSYVNLQCVGYVVSKPAPRQELLRILDYLLSGSGEEYRANGETIRLLT